jgi:hypothetical protein
MKGRYYIILLLLLFSSNFLFSQNIYNLASNIGGIYFAGEEKELTSKTTVYYTGLVNSSEYVFAIEGKDIIVTYESNEFVVNNRQEFIIKDTSSLYLTIETTTTKSDIVYVLCRI